MKDIDKRLIARYVHFRKANTPYIGRYVVFMLVILVALLSTAIVELVSK